MLTAEEGLECDVSERWREGWDEERRDREETEESGLLMEKYFFNTASQASDVQ